MRGLKTGCGRRHLERVPPGLARIRTIVTAEPTQDDLERALRAYETVGREMGVIGG